MRPTKAQMAALSRRDPVLGKAMKKLPAFPDFPAKPRLPYFHTLARTIIYQQLATGAASTIHDRVKALEPESAAFSHRQGVPLHSRRGIEGRGPFKKQTEGHPGPGRKDRIGKAEAPEPFQAAR